MYAGYVAPNCKVLWDVIVFTKANTRRPMPGDVIGTHDDEESALDAADAAVLADPKIRQASVVARVIPR